MAMSKKKLNCNPSKYKININKNGKVKESAHGNWKGVEIYDRSTGQKCK